MQKPNYTIEELKALVGKPVYVCFGADGNPKPAKVDGLFSLNKIDYKVKIKFENNPTTHIIYPNQFGTTEQEARANFLA